MAENKKSVLLYCDIIHTVDTLTDEEAGKLFKHYLRYINDLNPQAEDRLTSLLFEPIKQNLKRDLKKWESIICKRSEAGLASAEKRKQNQQVLTSDNKSKQVSTVKDTVNVNVKVKEINIPTELQFLEFCKTIKDINYSEYEFSFKSKFETWLQDEWKDGNGKKIVNWKSKIKNTIPYLKPMKQVNKGSQVPNAIG